MFLQGVYGQCQLKNYIYLFVAGHFLQKIELNSFPVLIFSLDFSSYFQKLGQYRIAICFRPRHISVFG